MTSVRVTAVDAIGPGTMKAFPIDDAEVLVANCDGTFYAVSNRCTHMGGHLSEGNLDGFVVRCPRHGACFDVRTGANVASPKIGPLKMHAADLRSYAIHVDNESIEIIVE
jgi:3-phenylpropionate/trans-cinnamate dioxygenase ferredoxin subunit